MDYDVIVVGAGHAGIEAALAASRLGCKTAIICLDLGTIGLMSCNPAIGGVGKGQLVKEIDALGGQMAKAADACAIQFRVLNASKGPAVQSSRAQVDIELYNRYMQQVTGGQDNLKLKQAEVSSLIVENNTVRGIITDKDEKIIAGAVVVCAGTFLNGLIHVGLEHFSAGRINEPAAIKLDANLSSLGFELLRFKTGTCARLDKSTIDFSRLTEQEPDNPARVFSFQTQGIRQKQVPCHITYTNERTHEIIRQNLSRSPLYAGIIKATGVRYCPSIEDKVVKFSERDRHQIFLEPEGLATARIYPNGLSTSLPQDVQLEMIHSIKGLEEAGVIRFGYGIEHTVVEPTQLYPNLETKLVRNLFLAGQINGTTGYEEAAAQGLVAGINASLRLHNKEPLVLDRATSYIGVLIDDLTTKGTAEPYRMFTSRVEYRLILREDNADLRLGKTGYQLGLVSEEAYKRLKDKEEQIKQGMHFINKTHLLPEGKINEKIEAFKSPALKRKTTLAELLKRPEIRWKELASLGAVADIPEAASKQIEIEVKYSGFISRQLKEVERFKNLERIRLPEKLDYTAIAGLSREIKEKLTDFRPVNLGQASRISGITPAAISILMVYLNRKGY